MEKENMDALYAASRNGVVSTLTTLIQRDAGIIDRVSLTFFSETPLHLSALHDHLEFSKILISKKPTLAKEVDSLGRTPLHLASAEGNTEIVKVLLQANTDICLARDQDERIPLHLASMRGRREIIEELINARRESILMNLNGDSVLHLCIQYNHFDALKLLVESANGDELFLNSRDCRGNSVLHLAVMLKQMKAIKYLLSVPEIKREANAMNMIGFTPLNVLGTCNACPKDFKCFEIQNILKAEAGVKRSTDLNSSVPLALRGIGVGGAQQARSMFRRWWECVHLSLNKRWKHQKNWKDKTRGTLMVVATVIATMAFQAGINPPGGVWQQNTPDSTNGYNCNQDNICEAGTAVLSYSNLDDYLVFLGFNTISFFASACVILLVIIEFPLRSKLFIWLLTSAMTISVASMTLTYIKAVVLVTPKCTLKRFRSLAWFLVYYIWVGVVLIAGVIHIIRLLYWMVKKLCTFSQQGVQQKIRLMSKRETVMIRNSVRYFRIKSY
ncbi:ankyrin repeat-containing protein ITN1-like [Alnus glutinosa]|uniref:ankyrin repeat-containing protein ITN1-like n=1 Tax=Alnus glutinosa TaxID=3517 RepID=UPI002D78E5AE|nr:ankyrin repeat-containing protein ITN1-like [Alnus glutinosa]